VFLGSPVHFGRLGRMKVEIFYCPV
jgi:hypothetical protein